MKHIGIVGCGTMGSGIVQVVVRAGYSVMVNETDQVLLDKGLKRIKGGLENLCEKGTISAQEKEEGFARVSGTVSLNDLADCDLVIETVFEDLKVKMDVFKALEAVCKPEATIASNTSSLSVTKMAASTSRRTQFVGLHFFNPPVVMPLVEVIKTVALQPEVLREVLDFVRSLGKTPIVAKDNAGFVVNLFLTPYLMDAIRGVGEGVASVQDIDLGMKLGCNHPMGPLMLADFIGLDVLLSGASTMFEEYKEKRYAPPPILKKLVLLGELGQKTGKGFYDWSDPKKPVPRDFGA